MIFDADLEKSVWSESVTIVNFSEQNSRRGKYMYESECISYENIWIECYSTCSWCDDDYDDDDLVSPDEVKDKDEYDYDRFNYNTTIDKTSSSVLEPEDL